MQIINVFTGKMPAEYVFCIKIKKRKKSLKKVLTNGVYCVIII